MSEVIDDEQDVSWGNDTKGGAEGTPCDWKETSNDKAIAVTPEVGLSASMVDIYDFMTATCGRDCVGSDAAV